jgi:hypothetical protein
MRLWLRALDLAGRLIGTELRDIGHRGLWGRDRAVSLEHWHKGHGPMGVVTRANFEEQGRGLSSRREVHLWRLKIERSLSAFLRYERNVRGQRGCCVNELLTNQGSIENTVYSLVIRRYCGGDIWVIGHWAMQSALIRPRGLAGYLWFFRVNTRPLGIFPFIIKFNNSFRCYCSLACTHAWIQWPLPYVCKNLSKAIETHAVKSLILSLFLISLTFEFSCKWWPSIAIISSPLW